MIAVTKDGHVLGATPFEINKHLYVRVDGVRRPVSHLILESFVGPCPEGMEALHANDIGDDNRLENLRWGTRAENVADSVRNGTHCQVAKTRCVNDHEFTPENTLVGRNKKGIYRRCRKCHNADNHRRRAS